MASRTTIIGRRARLPYKMSAMMAANAKPAVPTMIKPADARLTTSPHRAT
jgi:hypothetical protein